MFSNRKNHREIHIFGSAPGKHVNTGLKVTVLSGDARCHRTDRIVGNMKCTKLGFPYLQLPLKTEFTETDFYNSSWEIKANESHIVAGN